MRMYNIQDVKMTSLAFIFVLFCTLLVTVSGQQQSIVSTNTITSGGPFSVYCDASRAATPSGVYSVQSLFIYRMVATERNYSLIAQYNSVNPPGLSGETRNIPNGRLWNITFSGANAGVNNIATMKIVVNVTDAMCSDAGMYRCQIDYYTTPGSVTGSVIVTALDQNVTASMGLSGLDLSVQPDVQVYNQDDNVTFTCKVTGPATGVSFRWEFWIEDEFGIQQPTNLPSNSAVVNSPAAPQTGSPGCPQFQWVSTLSIQVPADFEQQVYRCIVSYMQMEQSSNRTIGITGLIVQPSGQVAQGSSPDVGMIVGIVIGCIVAILIVIGIVFFIRYRKRSQENRSGGKDQHDAPNDANLHAPPPVFYPSKKASKDEDSKIPTGMTNDALDTSYDSRDSTSKGPPRYANTESDNQGPPRYEKETHKGRQNRGYDEEERDRNGGHGRKQPRERQERQERKHRSRDYDDDEPRHRYYTTDDGTDSRQIDMGDPNMGTSI